MSFQAARAIRLLGIKQVLRRQNIVTTMGRTLYYNHVVFLRKRRIKVGIAFGSSTRDYGDLSVKESMYFVISENNQDDYSTNDLKEAVKEAIKLSEGPRDTSGK